MNANHIKWAGAGVAVIMGLFPPWERLRVGSIGYSFIGDPPPVAEVDMTRLIIQWMVVGAIVYGMLKWREKTDE